MKRMSMKYITINGQKIRKREPFAIRIAKRSPSDQKPVYGNEVEIIGNARLIYDPDKRLVRCGARCVLVVDDARVIR